MLEEFISGGDSDKPGQCARDGGDTGTDPEFESACCCSVQSESNIHRGYIYLVGRMVGTQGLDHLCGLNKRARIIQPCESRSPEA